MNIVRTSTVVAGTTTENLVAGSAFEFARGRTVVSMGIVATQTDLFITIQSGGNVVAEEFLCPVEATAGVYPTTNEEFYFQFAMAPGDRLVIRARNDAGTDTDARLVVAMAVG